MTGGALFPAAGSWNPTLTMCGFAQDLAGKLHGKRGPIHEALAFEEDEAINPILTSRPSIVQ